MCGPLYCVRLTGQDVEVVSRLLLLDDQLPLGVNLLVHTLHHLPHVLRLQSLQKVVVCDGIVDEFLCAESKTTTRFNSVCAATKHQP